MYIKINHKNSGHELSDEKHQIKFYELNDYMILVRGKNNEVVIELDSKDELSWQREGALFIERSAALKLAASILSVVLMDKEKEIIKHL